MKRCFAALLALALLLCGAPAVACDHGEVLLRIDYRDLIKVKIDDDLTHTLSGTECVVFYYRDCGEDVEVRPVRQVYDLTLRHEYDEAGFCPVCSHTNACDHDFPRERVAWERDVSDPEPDGDLDT